MLHDKLSGFITVLHAAMDGQDGPTYCPRYSMRHIKDWLQVSAIAVVSSRSQKVELVAMNFAIFQTFKSKKML